MIKLHVKYRLLFGLFLFFTTLVAQEKDNDFGIQLNYHYGFISPHNVLVNEIVKGHTQMTEFSFFKQTTGKNQWEQFYNYPKIGISSVVINSGNDESLGNIYGLFPFVEFPLNHWKIKWNIKFGYGVGYIEKPFDRVTNYKNLVIGTHLNALIFFDNNWSIPVSKNLNTSVGLSLTHFSNGSIKRPNLGINIFAMNVGLNYNFGNTTLNEKSDEKRDRNLSQMVVATTGFKEIDPIGGNKYMVYNVSYNAIKVVSNKSSFGVGADFFYNSSLEPLIVRLQNEDLGKKGNINVGLSGIYSLDLGKISMLFQTGGYVYRSYLQDKAVYTRIGTRYRFSGKLFFNLSLKTHFFVADFIEYGIGYKFY